MSYLGKKIAIAMIAIFFYSPIYCVVLRSLEGKEYTINDQKLLVVAPALSFQVEHMPVNTSIKSLYLALIIDSIEKVSQLKRTQKRVYIFTQVEAALVSVLKELHLNDLIALFKASIELNIEVLANAYSYAIAQKIHARPKAAPKIMQVMEHYFHALAYQYIKKHMLLLTHRVKECTIDDFITLYGQPIVTSAGELCLKNCGITSLFGIDCIEHTDTVRTINLSNNKLLDSSLDTHCLEEPFIKYKQLKELYLHNNLFSCLQASLFNGLKQLELLSLNNNSITTFSDGVFADLTCLEKLFLHNNSIEYIQQDIFKPVGQLTWLYLYNNPLATMYKIVDFKKLYDLDPCAYVSLNAIDLCL